MDTLDKYFAAIEASTKIEKSEGLDRTINTLFNQLDKDTQGRLKYMTIDGDAKFCDLRASFDMFKGEIPEHIEESVILKAIELKGEEPEDLIKGRLNIANLVPVRRAVRNKNGRVYYKTVYVKKEEMTAGTSRGRKFLAQNEYESKMKVGDKIKGRFKGWSSGTEYETDSLEIKEIHDDHIVAKFYRDFKVPGGRYTYGPGSNDERGRTVKLPRVTSSDWHQSVSFEKKPEPRVEWAKLESFSDVSVGDTVQAKKGQEVFEAKVTYIHPQGQFLKVKFPDGTVARRAPSALKYRTEKKEKKLSPALVQTLKDKGVTFSMPYRNNEERNQEAVEQFNAHFEGYDLDQWIADTKEAIKKNIGASAADNSAFRIDLDSNGNFELDVFGKDSSGTEIFRMHRKFSFNPRMNQTSVYHSLFTVARSLQGKDLGKDLFKALYKQYKSANISRISVTANISVGGYAWGKYGFTCDYDTAQDLVRNFRVGKSNNRVESYSIRQRDVDQAREAVRDFYRQNDERTRFPVRLLCNIGPNNKAGKIALLGTRWEGSIDLTDNDQRAVFENYIGATGD